MSEQRTMAQQVASKAHEVIVEDSQKAKQMVRDAVQSRAYFYPIKVTHGSQAYPVS